MQGIWSPQHMNCPPTDCRLMVLLDLSSSRQRTQGRRALRDRRRCYPIHPPWEWVVAALGW